MFYEQDATGQILSLSRVTTLGRLRAGLSYLVEAHGFRYYMFTCLGAELERTRTLVLHNLPCEQPAPPWPLETDPLAQYALAESLPLDWRGLMARPDFLARGYQVTMRQRAALGLRAGCTVPCCKGRAFSPGWIWPWTGMTMTPGRMCAATCPAPLFWAGWCWIGSGASWLKPTMTNHHRNLLATVNVPACVAPAKV